MRSSARGTGGVMGLSTQLPLGNVSTSGCALVYSLTSGTGVGVGVGRGTELPSLQVPSPLSSHVVSRLGTTVGYGVGVTVGVGVGGG